MSGIPINRHTIRLPGSPYHAIQVRGQGSAAYRRQKHQLVLYNQPMGQQSIAGSSAHLVPLVGTNWHFCAIYDRQRTDKTLKSLVSSFDSMTGTAGAVNQLRID